MLIKILNMNKMKKITKTILKKRAKRLMNRQNKELWTKLRNEVILEQDNRCYLCNKKIKKSKIDLHHIIDRRIKKLTYDKLNLVGLCKRCHRLSPYSVHQSSIVFSDLLKNKETKRYNYLLKKLDEVKNGRKF